MEKIYFKTDQQSHSCSQPLFTKLKTCFIFLHCTEVNTSL